MWSELRRKAHAAHGHVWLLCEALAALAIARLAMACLPFRRIAGWLGTPGAESPMTASAEQVSTALRVGWAVGVWGRRVPWDARCLAQALAATGMLRRRGLEGTVSFGARQGTGGGFEAHAWLRFGSEIVTGGGIHEQFKPFTTFARG